MAQHSVEPFNAPPCLASFRALAEQSGYREMAGEVSKHFLIDANLRGSKLQILIRRLVLSIRGRL
jgi:hypothetical protein